jgi:hypothetical protein
VPSPKPLSQRDVQAREELGLGRQRKNSRQWPPWDFSKPIEILRIKADKKRRCNEELTFLCKTFFLEQLGEKQETPARKARSLQQAQQWRKRLQRYLAELEQAKDEKAVSTLVRRMRSVQLPQALEQEICRMQRQGDSIEQSVATLQEKYRKASHRGRIKSHALTRLIHRLQGLASEYRPCLTWRSRNVPPDLIRFIRATLAVAGIRHAGGNNPSKFRKHMVKPAKTTKSPAKAPELEIESPLEQRLAKLYL